MIVLSGQDLKCGAKTISPVPGGEKISRRKGGEGGGNSVPKQQAVDGGVLRRTSEPV